MPLPFQGKRQKSLTAKNVGNDKVRNLPDNHLARGASRTHLKIAILADCVATLHLILILTVLLDRKSVV